jgi:transcriptional regulator with XRE-family HTH domain
MNRIQELRKKSKMRQVELASILGISQSALSYWERGDYEPDNESLMKIADIFNTSIDYLLCRTDDPALIITSNTTSKETALEVLVRTEGLSPKSREDLLEYVDLLKIRDMQKRNAECAEFSDELATRRV